MRGVCGALVVQGGKLPLHLAAASQAPVEVITALLDAHREAASTADQVRFGGGVGRVG